jgi:hypothetical protein
MRTPGPLALVTLALVGCSHRGLDNQHGQMPPPPPPPPVVGNTVSYVVNATVLGDPETLTLHLDRDTKQLTLGLRGDTQTVPVTQSGDEWVGPDTVSLSRGCGARNPGYVTFQGVRLRAGDKSATLSVHGDIGVISGDTIDSHPLDTAFTGGLDNVAPALVECISYPRILDFPEAPLITFSEPLTRSAVVQLVPDVGTPLVVSPDHLPAARFGGGAMLAFGRSYQVAVHPFTDLGGLAGAAAALPSFSTPALDFAAQDGFEGDAAAVLRGGAVIADAQAPAAITGQRSLYLPQGSTYVARLRAVPGATALHLSARGVLTRSGDFATPAGANDFWVDLAAPYGTSVRTLLRAGQEPFSPDANDAERQVGTAAELTVPLPPGVDGEVMIRIYNFTGFWGDSPHHVQLDDLRLE